MVNLLKFLGSFHFEFYISSDFKSLKRIGLSSRETIDKLTKFSEFRVTPINVSP